MGTVAEWKAETVSKGQLRYASSGLLLFLKRFLFLFLREREHTRGGEGQRRRERENE